MSLKYDNFRFYWAVSGKTLNSVYAMVSYLYAGILTINWLFLWS